MEVNVERLIPGMVLKKTVLGKSGNPIVEKNTILTKTHIEFIRHFLIDKVAVDPMNQQTKTDSERTIITNQESQLFIDEVEQVVQKYQHLFTCWQNNVPIHMYKIRELCIPIFEKITEQDMDVFLLLVKDYENTLYRDSVIRSLLSVYLSFQLGYDKKDWLQIGFSALLSDCGKAKLAPSIVASKLPESAWKMYPVYSYKMIENESTLTQQAKIAILQHREYLDGSGFPAKSRGNKVSTYARIIAVCDVFISVYSTSPQEIIGVLENYKLNKLDKLVVDPLVNELQGTIK